MVRISRSAIRTPRKATASSAARRSRRRSPASSSSSCTRRTISAARRSKDLTHPMLETDGLWSVYGFTFPNYLATLGGSTDAQLDVANHASLDKAMRDAFRKLRRFLMTVHKLSEDEAIALMSVAADFGVTQVVDATGACTGLSARTSSRAPDAAGSPQWRACGLLRVRRQRRASNEPATVHQRESYVQDHRFVAWQEILGALGLRSVSRQRLQGTPAMASLRGSTDDLLIARLIARRADAGGQPVRSRTSDAAAPGGARGPADAGRYHRRRSRLPRPAAARRQLAARVHPQPAHRRPVDPRPGSARPANRPAPRRARRGSSRPTGSPWSWRRRCAAPAKASTWWRRPTGPPSS